MGNSTQTSEKRKGKYRMSCTARHWGACEDQGQQKASKLEAFYALLKISKLSCR
jgi:hypothetical protein